MPADTTIIIVTYNSAHIIGEALDNLPEGYPTIIIDNASEDDTCEKIKSHSRPDVTLIRHHKNSGYGTANNIGLKKCTTRYALILNPDAEITGSSIEQLKAALQSHPTAVLAGPRILKSASDMRKKKVKIKLYPLFHKYNPLLNSKMKFWVRRSYKTTDLSKPHETAFVVGAVMLCDLQKMPEPIYFDEDIFMYGDEGEWQSRISNAGYKILIVPYATAYHRGESSSEFTNDKEKIWNRYYNEGKTKGVLARKYPCKTTSKEIKLFISTHNFFLIISCCFFLRKCVNRYSALLRGFKDAFNGTK